MKAPILQVTENALKRIQYLLEQRGKPSAGVRVGVRSGGCSGHAYTFEYADEIRPYDEVISLPVPQQTANDTETHSSMKPLENNASSFTQPAEINILIDPKAIIFLLGSTMDFVEGKIESGFTFINPNEKGRCGCGESFNV